MNSSFFCLYENLALAPRFSRGLESTVRSLFKTAAVLLVASAATCKSGPSLEIDVSTGQEKGALSADPKVVRVDVFAASADGKTHVKASAAPGGSFDLGKIDDTVAVSFCLSGVDANGHTVARGQSVSMVPGSFKNGAVPLFIERLGSFARPDGQLAVSHVHAPAGVLSERYVFITGGDSALDANGPTKTTTGADFYDLLSQSGQASGSSLPLVAETIVMRGTRALVINHDTAQWIDFAGAAPLMITPPDGFKWSDVAGGAAIDTASGSTYVVGATRATGATSVILAVDANGNLSTKALLAPRVGAAVMYAKDQGLIVAGGSADAPGVELLPDTGNATALNAPNDATTGAALATLAPASNGLALLVGGVFNGAPAATRQVDLRCGADQAACVTDLGGAAIDTIATRSQAFSITNGVVVIGDAPSGETLAFQVTASPLAATPLPLRDRRLGATAIPTPNGMLAILGGELVSGGAARTVELLFPPGSDCGG